MSQAATFMELDARQAEQQVSQLVSTGSIQSLFAPPPSAAWNALLQAAGQLPSEADVEGQLAAGEQAAGQQLVSVYAAATCSHAAPAGSAPPPERRRKRLRVSFIA